MKNWIVTLVILALPVAAYFGLKANQENQAGFIAQAADKPSVIKFASPMCLDCKKLKEEMAPLKPTYQDSVNFIEIDATANDKKTQEQIEMYGVTVVPTLIFIDDNNHKVKKVEGFTEKNKIEEYIKELING